MQRVLVLAVVLRVGLIYYGAYQDAHSVLKYTDVDYRVFSDAARYIINPAKDQYASGPLVRILGWDRSVGDPYSRETYRYTPLLALLLVPNETLHPFFGKFLFALCDILIGALLYSIFDPPSKEKSSRKAVLWIGGLWLLNPMPANISTRGSAESVLGLLVVSTLVLLKRHRFDAAAVMLGLSVHFKIYPFIYGVSALAFLSPAPPTKSSLSHGSIFSLSRVITRERMRFASLSLATFVFINAIMFGIWGQPFLKHTYFYHLTRRDHRHNFSLYFYPTYLTYSIPPGAQSILRGPLLSFLPQLSLCVGSGFVFGGEDIAFAWFVQTACFVIFNKVSTSQYFMWYLWFLPLVLPRLKLSRTRAVVLLAVWVGAQALWLSIAYRLEFLGEDVYLALWGASVAFLVMNSYVLVEIIQAYN